MTVPVIKDGGWQLSEEYAGDETQPPFRVLFRRFAYRDRLQVALWADRQAMMDDGGEDAINEEFGMEESRAIAARLRDPDTQEQWTPETVEELGGHSAAARGWLYDLLYQPIFDELESGLQKKNWEKRLSIRAQILRLQLDLVRSA